MNSDIQKNISNLLSQNELLLIFDFLHFKDLLSCSRVSKKFNITSFKAIKYTNLFELTNNLSIQFFEKYVVEPKELNIFNTGDLGRISIQKIFTREISRVSTIFLNIIDESFLTDCISCIRRCYPGVTDLTIYGKNLNDDHILILKNFQNLKKLRITGEPYIEGTHFQSLNPLELLELYTPTIGYKSLKKLLFSSRFILTHLTIDIDEYSNEDISDLFDILSGCSLSSIDLKYCSSLDDDDLVKLKNLTTFSKISFRKAAYITSLGYLKFFDIFRPKLKIISLIMNNYLNSEVLKRISKCCPNLEELDVTWCEDVCDEGIYSVLLNCPNLERLEITGIKKATQKSFPLISQYYQDFKTGNAFDIEENRIKIKESLLRLYNSEAFN